MSQEETFTITLTYSEKDWHAILDTLYAGANSKGGNWPVWFKGFKAFIESAIQQVKAQRKAEEQAKNQQTSIGRRYGDATDKNGNRYFLGDDGSFHDEEYFAEQYGSYQEFIRLSDEAFDMGFPDVESYQAWLDDD